MRYFAIPMRADGTEQPGRTLGVISGRYQSLRSFMRYAMRPYANPNREYAIYRVFDCSTRWSKIGHIRALDSV